MEQPVPETIVKALDPGDAGAMVALRREALAAHPLAFASSLEDDRAVSVDLMRTALGDAAGSAVYGAFRGAELVGMVGVYRPAKVKMRHRAEVWGVYVSPDARGRGVGDALLRAVIEHCRVWPGVRQLKLSVSETAPEAARLYERHGFRAWGREPRSLAWEGRFVDERHMVLDLDGVMADLDHLVVVAPTLEEGSAYVRGLLGRAPFEGGRHRELGTHNRLLRIGRDLFLEVIAPDPASSHTGPRVFGIGDAASVRADWTAGRRLRAYVARTPNLGGVEAEHAALLGEPKHVTRGARAWRMLIPADGSLPLGGMAPTVVEYEPGMVPAAHMPESDCELLELVVACPDATAVDALHAALGLGGAVTVRAATEARLVAVLATPAGIATLV